MRLLLLFLLVGLGLGFILANAAFRLDQNRPDESVPAPSLNSPASADSSSAPADDSNPLRQTTTDAKTTEEGRLSVDELRQAIAKAEQDKDNAPLQRNLGIAVFKYSALEQRVDFLPDAVRLMERALPKTSAKDRELNETLGNALFVLARQGQPGRMPSARQAYQRALQAEPDNAELLVNLGLTYFFDRPTDPAAALSQYTKALKIDPRSEIAIESSIVAWLALKQNAKAVEGVHKLRQLNPHNDRLNDLESEVNQALLNKNQD